MDGSGVKDIVISIPNMSNILIMFLALILFFMPSIVWSEEYALVMSKEDNVCQHMLKLYNADLKKYGQVKYKQHKEFNWIKWEDKEISIRPAGTPEEVMDIDAKIAFFDINNDSKDEAIIYHESMLFNRPMDVYDIFRTDDLAMLDDVVDGKIYYSKTQKSFDSNEGTTLNVYEISDNGLKKLPKRMRDSVKAVKSSNNNNLDFVGGPQKIYFIKINDHFFMYFEGPRGIGPNESYKMVEHYGIISEYQQDKTLKNLCLYLIKKGKQTKRSTN